MVSSVSQPEKVSLTVTISKYEKKNRNLIQSNIKQEVTSTTMKAERERQVLKETTEKLQEDLKKNTIG